MKEVRSVTEEVRQMIEQMADEDVDVSEWERRFAGAGAIRSIVKIPGDASTRRYYRIRARSASGDRSFILMRVEPFPGQAVDYPFLAVREHLERSGVDVPRVHDVDADRGFVLLEDLGDTTLLRRLQEVSNADVERHLYERVIDGLVQLQVKASEGGGGLEAFGLFFDHAKLMWEIDFCIDHFYKTYLNRDLGASDIELMRDQFGEICRFLAAQPTVLTHRDFHSRNVMLAPGGEGEEERLVMIDFQDARMGPPQYDLASLLKDSYYQLEERQVTLLLDYYIARWEAVSGRQVNREEFLYVFDLMSVQRNFKAIGSFASFLNRRGNATYLKYIGNTFENIRRTLLKYPRYAPLREVLFHYYYF